MKTICVYLGSRQGKDPLYAEKVQELGTWIGKNGYRLTYGGSRIGLMGLLAKSAMQAGGCVIGVEPRIFVNNELQLDGLDELIVTEDMAERKARLIALSDVFIAFPGGTGTLEEITEIMSGVSLGIIRGICIVYNLNGYYDLLEQQLDRMTDSGFIDPGNREKILFCRSLREIEDAVGRPQGGKTE